MDPHQFPCPRGYFVATTGSDSISDCQECAAGTFCPLGTSIPQSCPAGHYCLDGTETAFQYPCPAGTSLSTLDNTMESQCIQCGVGEYCPPGSAVPTKCPAGTYQPGLGAKYRIDCLDCEPGYSCPYEGMETYTNTDCVVGHFCPRGTVSPYRRPCPGGAFTDSINLTSLDECSVCWYGFSCPSGTGGPLKVCPSSGFGTLRSLSLSLSHDGPLGPCVMFSCV